MIRRKFLETTALAGAGLLIPKYRLFSTLNESKIRLPKMKLNWFDKKTTRPFTPDVDAGGTIWFGSAEHFFSLNTHSMEIEEHDTRYLEGKPFSTTICQNGKVYILAQKSPYLYTYHPDKKEYSKHVLPDSESNIWFGVRAGNEPRIYLYVRNRSKLLVWNTENDTGKEIPYPEKMDLWSGFFIPDDNAIYSFTLDAKPSRLIRFDLSKQRFDTPIPTPEPGLEITGVNPIDNTVYCADRFTGRIFPFNFEKRKWEEPIHIPGHKTIFGFIGMGTTFKGLALYCLSTYKGSMKWDFNTNKYLSEGDENIGIDGKPHHFLNKYLVFDPVSRQSGFLEAAETPGKTYPLICYSMIYKNKLFITGYDLGDVHNNLAPMGTREGKLCVFHSI